VHAIPQTTQQGRFSRVELRAQALASRQAKKQLLQIPWSRFRKAYEEYPQWQGLSLWTRAVVTAKGHASTELLKTLRERCPGFLESEESIREPNLLAFHLLEWVHSRIFDHAKRQGWLDALTFYGVRHLRSQAVWAFWEHCENEWSRVLPKAVPSFEEWRQRALERKVYGEVTYAKVVSAVERYIDWEAMSLWLSPLFASGTKLPLHVVSELERRLPSACWRLRSAPGEKGESKSTNWRFVIRAGKEQCLADAKGADGLHSFVEWVRSHPQHVLLAAYGKHWRKERSKNQPQRYPSFRQWRLAAGRYSKASPNRSQRTPAPA